MNTKDINSSWSDQASWSAADQLFIYKIMIRLRREDEPIFVRSIFTQNYMLYTLWVISKDIIIFFGKKIQKIRCINYIFDLSKIYLYIFI